MTQAEQKVGGFVAHLNRHGYKFTGEQDYGGGPESIYKNPYGSRVALTKTGKWKHYLSQGTNRPSVLLNEGTGDSSLKSHLDKHYSSQHSEKAEQEPSTSTMRETTLLHGTHGGFAPAILTKKVKAETTQYAEQKMVAGRSRFLISRNRGTVGGRRVHNILHRILQQHGGSVHNAHGGFTLPKRAIESFNEAANGAGFQHGHHYSLNG